MEWFDFIRIFWHANGMRVVRINLDVSPVKRESLRERIASAAIPQNCSDRIIL